MRQFIVVFYFCFFTISIHAYHSIMQRNLAIYSRRRLLSTTKSDLDVIQHKHLINQGGFINGKFTRGAAMSDFEVINPATGKPLITLPSMGLADTKDSIDAASKAWATWKNTTPFERSKLLSNLFNLMNGKYKDDLAAIVTLEAGKPLAEAKGEMTYANSFLEYYAEEAKRSFGEVVPSPMKNRRLVTIKQPIGPTALITPWNFPSAMITRKLAPALAAGCTVVIKPANETPLSALAICAIAQEAGIPAGVINVVTVPREHVEAVGKELCNSKDIRKVSFTGSTAVGKWLMREAASTVKKVALELGGNAPFIVFDDADLDIAVNAVMAAKFRNAGQACIAANRVFVQDKVYDAFAAKLTVAVNALKIGNGFAADSTIGPLINAKGLEKVTAHVENCKALGAQILAGGQPSSINDTEGGFFFNPTIISHATKEMLPFCQETFGPIIPLMKFTTDEEAIELANDTEFGLAAYFCTKDLTRAWTVAEALEAGMVGVNEGAISTANVPFGGIKESGIGREGSHQGLNEFLEEKYICFSLPTKK